MLEKLNASYDGDMTIRFICFDSVYEDEDFREKMLLHNSIGGHLSLSIAFEGDRKIYRYDISGHRSLRDVLSEKSMTEEFLIRLLRELERIFLRGKSYMFSEENYVLHPDAIFIGADGQIGLCYLPGFEKNIQEQLCEMLGFLMNCVDVSDRRSVYAVYSTFSAARDGNCTFAALISALENNRNNVLTEFGETDELNKEVERKDEGKGTEVKGVSEKMLKRLRPGSGFRRKMGYLLLSLSFVILIAYFLII